jgi:hypothetical protein
MHLQDRTLLSSGLILIHKYAPSLDKLEITQRKASPYMSCRACRGIRSISPPKTFRHSIPLLVLFYLAIISLGSLIASEGPVTAGQTPTEIPPSAKQSGKIDFFLYTRLQGEAWSLIKDHVKEGDLFWGRDSKEVPKGYLGMTIRDFENFSKKWASDEHQKYKAINLDGEYKDFDLALEDAKKFRQAIDKINGEREKDPIQFVAFYHMEIIDAHPEIVKYPDVVMIGKTYWNAQNITGDGKTGRRREAAGYIKLIRDAGREPAILLGGGESKARQFNITSDSVIETAKVCLASPSEGGLGVKILGFYYDRDKSGILAEFLSKMR